MLDIKPTRDLLKEKGGLVSSLYARRSLCHSLGLISAKEAKDIESIGSIRNDFAHRVECDFSDERITRLSNSLKVGLEAIDKLPTDHKSRVADPHQRFSMVITSLVSSLYNRAHYVRVHCVKNERIFERGFP